MKLFFLSGQTTCAMLLGAGLLLRAQAALRTEPEAATPAAIEAPRTTPAELASSRPRASERSVVVRRGKQITHTRKGFTHRERGRHARKRGVAIAGRTVRWG